MIRKLTHTNTVDAKSLDLIVDFVQYADEQYSNKRNSFIVVVVGIGTIPPVRFYSSIVICNGRRIDGGDCCCWLGVGIKNK